MAATPSARRWLIGLGISLAVVVGGGFAAFHFAVAALKTQVEQVLGPRGEVGSYIVSDGSAKPYRMKWRGASFSNLSILPHIIPGHKVADVVAIMGSVDPVFGEVDR